MSNGRNMNQSRLRSPYEHLTGDDQGLGDGLTTAELFFWAERKRQQNQKHYEAGHRLCSQCKNCLCGKSLGPDFGFRCICDTGKTYITPYRIRFFSTVDKNHALNREIYCLDHHVYEPKGLKHDA